MLKGEGESRHKEYMSYDKDWQTSVVKIANI